MSSISKKLYIDELLDMVKKYNNTFHITIKMNPVDIKEKTYINFNKGNNYKDLKCKVVDYVRISKYKNIFPEGYLPNWKEEVFIIKKLKILNGGEVIGTFYEKKLNKKKKKKSKRI